MSPTKPKATTFYFSPVTKRYQACKLVSQSRGEVYGDNSYITADVLWTSAFPRHGMLLYSRKVMFFAKAGGVI